MGIDARYLSPHLGASKAERHELGILLSDVPLSCICEGSTDEWIAMMMDTYNLVGQAARHCFIYGTNTSRCPPALLHALEPLLVVLGMLRLGTFHFDLKIESNVILLH